MSRWNMAVLVVVVFFASLAFTTYLFRDSLATAALAHVVDHQPGLSCSHPRVGIASALDRVVVGPIECSIAEGPMASVQTFAPATIELDGMSVSRVHITAAAANFRERDVSHAHANLLGDLTNIVGLKDQLVKGMLDAHESYSEQTPQITVDRFTTLREGKREGVMLGYTVGMDGRWSRSHARELETGNEGLATVRNFEMRVTPTRGRLRMDIHLGPAERGDDPDMRLRVRSDDLGEGEPHFDFSIGGGEDSERED